MHARVRILFFATTTRMSPAFYDSPTQATKAARDDTVHVFIHQLLFCFWFVMASLDSPGASCRHCALVACIGVVQWLELIMVSMCH